MNADEIVDEILPDDVDDPMAAVAQKSDSPDENNGIDTKLEKTDD